MVYDRNLRRITQYVGPDVTRIWSLSDYGPFDSPVDAVGMLDGGRIVLRRTISPASEAGSTRANDELLTIDLATRRSRRLAEFDGDEIFVRRSSSGGRILGTPPLRRTSTVAVGSRVVAIGDSETGRIRVVRADSQSVREYEVRDGDRTLTEAGIVARLDEMLRERPRPVSPQWERLQREMIATERFPALGDLFIDGADRLWIQRWDRSRRGGQSWIVIDLISGDTAQSELPRYCRPTQITRELLTCVHSDPEELPTASTFRLTRRR